MVLATLICAQGSSGYILVFFSESSDPNDRPADVYNAIGEQKLNIYAARRISYSAAM